MAEPQEDSKTPEDDVRRQFREALERKQKHPGAAHEGVEGGGKSASKSNEKSQRMFRRKSGG